MTRAGGVGKGQINGGPKCPICGKPAIVRFSPFCSARCARIDLHRWFGEIYRVPEAEPSPETDPEGEDS